MKFTKITKGHYISEDNKWEIKYNESEKRWFLYKIDENGKSSEVFKHWYMTYLKEMVECEYFG